MLIVTRKSQQGIIITTPSGEEIEVWMLGVKVDGRTSVNPKRQVSIGIKASRDIIIKRHEHTDNIPPENQLKINL